MTQEAEERGISPYAVADGLASAINPGSDGLILLPHFTGKLSPDYNLNIKGVFWGGGLDKRKGHFIRSILEGVAYMLKENFDCKSIPE